MNKFWQRLGQRFQSKDKHTAMIVADQQQQFSARAISPNALKVLTRLNKAGFAAYLVGGSVRDILLQREPKDYDVATDALPEEVRKLFRNSRIIGRRFRLVHVFFPNEIIEVSTFRANVEDETAEWDPKQPVVIRADNTYGTIEEDAWRRDFTINALYYNINDFSVVDYTGGMLDLQERRIRMIGDPQQRFHEDPVRLLRAIRLAAKLDFMIDPQTETQVKQLTHLLRHVPPARLFDEVLKLFYEGNAEVTYKKLSQYQYMQELFPQSMCAIENRANFVDQKLWLAAMRSTDERVLQNKSLNPGFLLAIFLWPALQDAISHYQKDKRPFYSVIHLAIDDVLAKQAQTMMLPKRFKVMARSIWVMQYQLIRRRPRRALHILRHRYFRGAFDFLHLRVQAGESYEEETLWWQHLQDASFDEQNRMIEKIQSDGSVQS